MSAAHTQGLLVHDMRGYPHADLKAVSGRQVAVTWGVGRQPKTKAAYEKRTAEDRANARRLVACWNRLSIWTTDEIETGVVAVTPMDQYAADVKARNALVEQRADLLDQLKAMNRAYVNLLETGRDRILQSGGTCDPVDVMEAADPFLRESKAVIAKAEGGAL